MVADLYLAHLEAVENAARELVGAPCPDSYDLALGQLDTALDALDVWRRRKPISVDYEVAKDHNEEA